MGDGLQTLRKWAGGEPAQVRLGHPRRSRNYGADVGQGRCGNNTGRDVRKTKNNTEGNFSQDINLPWTGEVEEKKGHIHFQARTGASDSKSILVQGQGQ